MGRSFLCAVFATLCSVVPSAAQGPTPVLTHDAFLRESLDRISRGSARFREALEAVQHSGRRALVLTPEQVVVTDAQRTRRAAFDPTVLAEVTPVTNGASLVDTVLVVINVPLLERMHVQRNSLPVELEADLDRIVIHEVYGHAVPYLLAGDLSGQCADPAPGQRAHEACAIQRENAVRQELGLGRRTDAGLFGLTLAWRGRH